MADVRPPEIPYERQSDRTSNRMCGAAALCMVYRSSSTISLVCSPSSGRTLFTPGIVRARGRQSAAISWPQDAPGQGAVMLRSWPAYPRSTPGILKNVPRRAAAGHPQPSPASGFARRAFQRVRRLRRRRRGGSRSARRTEPARPSGRPARIVAAHGRRVGNHRQRTGGPGPRRAARGAVFPMWQHDPRGDRLPRLWSIDLVASPTGGELSAA